MKALISFKMLLFGFVILFTISCNQMDEVAYCGKIENRYFYSDTVLIGDDTFQISYYKNPELIEQKTIYYSDTTNQASIVFLDTIRNQYYYIGLLNNPSVSFEDFENSVKEANISMIKSSYFGDSRIIKTLNGKYKYVNLDLYRNDREEDYLYQSYYLNNRGGYFINVSSGKRELEGLSSSEIKSFKCFIHSLEITKLEM